LIEAFDFYFGKFQHAQIRTRLRSGLVAISGVLPQAAEPERAAFPKENGAPKRISFKKCFQLPKAMVIKNFFLELLSKNGPRERISL